MAITPKTIIPKRVLMGPGPSDVHPRVLAATGQPTIGHLDPVFQSLMDDVKNLLKYAFQTQNALTYPVSAPGSSGMETCFANLVEPGDKVIVASNGVFGGRMIENVKRMGGTAIEVNFEWGTAVDLNAIDDAFKTNPDAKILAFVHAETSTGVQSNAAGLCALATQYGALTIMDTVTGLAGIPILIDEWGVDAVYSGTQKCLACPPGLSPVSFSARAADVVKSRKSPVTSWFLDLSLVMNYWDGAGGRTYHHTAPVNAIYGLHEALLMLQEEGLEASWARHETMHNKLVTGLEGLGLTLPVKPEDRLPQLNLVSIPDGVDDASFRAKLLNDFDLEIGAGLGKFAGKAWRIGLMGQSACDANVDHCLKAFKACL